MTETVLSHLALKLATHPENIATEALGFILSSSAEARSALASLVQKLGFSCPEGMSYQTQASNDDGSRPDLVGMTPDQKSRLVIEAKFWAGLTDAQPIGYLDSLPGEGGLLLFVAPSQRLDTLWSELLRRCSDAGKPLQEPQSQFAEQRHVGIGSNTMSVVSWRVLLDTLAGALDRAGDRIRAADVQQLQGLCDAMDSEAFLPLHSEELTGTIGQRVIQFGQIASDLTDILVKRSDADVKGLRATGGNGWFGRYLRLKGHGSCLAFNSGKWANWGGSPLWLELKGADWKSSPALIASLTDAGINFRKSESDGACCIPIMLLTGVEREAVMDHALGQLDRIICVLPPIDDAVSVEAVSVVET